MNSSRTRGDDRAQLVDNDDLMHSPDDSGGGTAAVDGDTESSTREMSQLHMDSSHSQSRSTKPHNNDGLKTIIISCICFAVCVTVALIMTIYLGSPVLLPHGGVVSDSAVCSQLGLEMLKRGGSAVDAGVTTALCIGAVNPLSSGLGGGGFALVRQNKKNLTEIFDFMSSAPDQVSQSKGVGQSVGVPGLLRGLKKLHETYGRLRWREVVAPVVNLTASPITMSEELSNAVENLPDSSAVSKYFNSVTTANSASGTSLKQMNLRDLNQLLQAVGERGDRVLYEEGTAAQNLLNTVNDAGGKMSMEDLMSYSVQRLEPVGTSFLGNRVETVGAAGGGSVLLLMLNIINNITSTPLSNVAWNSTNLDHLFIEAAKFSMPHLSILDDPAFNSSINDIVNTIISQSYADKLSGRIDLGRTHPNQDYYSVAPLLSAAGGGTTGAVSESHASTHVSVIGPDDDMLSITMSLNDPFGSGLVTPNGIILNNYIITSNQSQSKKWNKGQRPVTTLAPVVVYNPVRSCSNRYSMGASHGYTAIQALASVIGQLIGQHKNLSESINTPRVYALPQGCILFEAGVAQKIHADLKMRGHYECAMDGPQYESSSNIVHSLAKINQSVYGESDRLAVDGGAAVY